MGHKSVPYREIASLIEEKEREREETSGTSGDSGLREAINKLTNSSLRGILQLQSDIQLPIEDLVKYSIFDINRGIKIPKTLSGLLDADTGIHIADGHLTYQPWKGDRNYSVTMNIYDDLQFVTQTINPILTCLYGTPFHYNTYRANKLRLRIGSMAIYTFKTRVLGMISGHRHGKIVIPKPYLGDKTGDHILTFIRFHRNCDGSLSYGGRSNNYPRIAISSDDQNSLRQIRTLLDHHTHVSSKLYKMTRRNSSRFSRNPEYQIISRGHRNLETWLEEIGIDDPKTLSKILVTETYGYNPPYTSLEERLSILAEDINPKSYYNGRIGDLRTKPHTYPYAREVFVLKLLAHQPAPYPRLTKILNFVPSNEALRQTVKSLLNKKEIKKSLTHTQLKITEHGIERLKHNHNAWKTLRQRFNIPIPPTPHHLPPLSSFLS